MINFSVFKADFIFYPQATCYFFGEGVEKDVNQAFLWYQEAARRGHIDSINNLGNARKIHSKKFIPKISTIHSVFPKIKRFPLKNQDHITEQENMFLKILLRLFIGSEKLPIRATSLASLI